MARIDLTSIPNAPQVVAPVLQEAAPTIDQGTLSKPLAGMQAASEGLGGAARASGNFAKESQAQGMGLDAFNGEAKGEEGLAKGIANIADPINQLNYALDRAKTASDMAKVDVALKQHSADLNNKLLTATPDQYDKIYQDSIPELQKNLEDLNLSPSAKLQLQPDLTKYLGTTSISIKTAAIKQTIENQRGDILNAVTADFNQGQYELGIKHLQAGVENHLFTQTEADAHIEKLHQAQIKQTDQAVINADPLGAEKDLQSAMKSGKSELFPHANPVEQERYLQQARSEVNRQRIDATRDIENKIDSGEITDNDQLKKAAGPILDDVSIQALESRMKNTMGPSPDTWLRIQGDIANLDPKDPDFQKKWLSIKSDVNQNVGSQWRGSMESQLYAKITQNQKGQSMPVDEKIQSAGFQRIKYLTENGAFGPFEVKRDPKTGAVDPAQLAAQTEAYGKAMDMNDALQSAIKAGKIPNSYSGMNAWINDQMTDAQKKILGNKLNQAQGGGFLNGVGNAINALVPNVPDSAIQHKDDTTVIPTSGDIRAKIGDPKASPTPAATPSATPLPSGAIPAPKGSKVTNYWQSEVKGTDGTKGNHDNQLQAGDFAASPDVEASLKANGAKPGDPVIIHLADGTTLNARFNDSTAQDDQQAAKGKTPLRGRFDMWTKTKGHPKDGVAVLGYSLPNRQS